MSGCLGSISSSYHSLTGDLAEVTAVLSLLGENQRWQSSHFPKGCQSWKTGSSLLPMPGPADVNEKCLNLNSRDFEGTLRARRTSCHSMTYGHLCTQCIPNVFRMAFRSAISPRGPHAVCGRGERRYFLSSFKMRKSRPRVVFLNIFITRDPFYDFSTMHPPVCKPLLNTLHLLSRHSVLFSFIRVTKEYQFLLSTKERATTEFTVQNCSMYSGGLSRFLKS